MTPKDGEASSSSHTEHTEYVSTNITNGVTNLYYRRPKREGLSASRQIEATLPWGSCVSLRQIIERIYLSVQQLELDNSGATYEFALPTVGGFWRVYRCFAIGDDRPDIEHGGKIILPPSAIEELAQHDFSESHSYNAYRNNAQGMSGL